MMLLHHFCCFIPTFGVISLYTNYEIMKKILLPLAAFALMLSACETNSKYTINGTVTGEQTGNIFLVKEKGRALDTLAKAVLTDGKFTLTGSADSLTEAYLTIEGKRSFSFIFLQNAKYTATLNPENPSETKIEGTTEQQIINQYLVLSNEQRKAGKELTEEYRAAAQAQDTAKMHEIENKMDQTKEATTAKEDELIKANPDTYAAAFILSMKTRKMSSEELNTLYNSLGEKAKTSAPGKKIAEYIEVQNRTAIGQVAPDFTLNTPTGEALSMHSVKGKVKIIDFWASWCGPCRMENPNVVKIYEEFQPKGLAIIGVSLDESKDAWTKAIEDDKLTWNHVSDLQGWANAAAKQYGISGIPAMIILDENNVIIAKNLRGEALSAKIAELLK